MRRRSVFDGTVLMRLLYGHILLAWQIEVGDASFAEVCDRRPSWRVSAYCRHRKA